MYTSKQGYSVFFLCVCVFLFIKVLMCICLQQGFIDCRKKKKCLTAFSGRWLTFYALVFHFGPYPVIFYPYSCQHETSWTSSRPNNCGKDSFECQELCTVPYFRLWVIKLRPAPRPSAPPLLGPAL